MPFQLNPFAADEQADCGRTGIRETRKESEGFSAYVGKISSLLKSFSLSNKVSRRWRLYLIAIAVIFMEPGN